MLFTILLLYAAYTDYTRREIPNSVILSMYALSVFSNASVFDKVTGLFLLTLPLFFVALKYDGMKGGDVKFHHIPSLSQVVKEIIAVLALLSGGNGFVWIH